MFPLVHIYTATQVAKKKTPLLVLGSVIPDFVWVSRDKLPYENLHNDIDDFYNFVQVKHKGMLDLALGMKLHSNKVGADLYSHLYEGGYSYNKGKQIFPDIQALVKGENKKLSDLSHSFIEASLDLLLYKDKSEVLDLYQKSLNEVDLDKISTIFSEYTKIDKELILKNIQALLDLVKPENLTSEQTFSKDILPKMIEIGFNQKVEESKILEILKKAMEITKADYKELLKNTILMMQKDFRRS